LIGAPNVSGSRPVAVIFDCDGVLVDSEGLASRVEAELAREVGLTLTPDEAHDLFLGKTVEGVLALIAERSGRKLAAPFVYNWAFATAHAFVRDLQPVAGVRAAIEELRTRGHALAVASQSPLARVRLSLEVTGLAGLFGEHIYVTSMVPRPKPAPDIYLLASERLGAAPADCVVIEDSPAGAAAARACGMQVFGYAPGGAGEAMRANGVTVMRSMNELPGLINPAR
jgi:HAD superfamily hydrolase (TIGR01509 family)